MSAVGRTVAGTGLGLPLTLLRILALALGAWFVSSLAFALALAAIMVAMALRGLGPGPFWIGTTTVFLASVGTARWGRSRIRKWLASLVASPDRKAAPRSVGFALGGVLIAAGGAFIASSSFRQTSEVWDLAPRTFFQTPGDDRLGILLTILLVAFAGPVIEEVVYRGWLQRELRSHLPRTTSWIFVALIFSLAHVAFWPKPGLLALAFGYSIWVSWIAVTTRSLALPIVVHATFNALAFAIWARPPAFGEEGVPLVGAGCILILAGAWLMMPRRKAVDLPSAT